MRVWAGGRGETWTVWFKKQIQRCFPSILVFYSQHWKFWYKKLFATHRFLALLASFTKASHCSHVYEIQSPCVIRGACLRYMWTRRQLLFLTCLPHRKQESGPLSVLWTSRMWILTFDLLTKVFMQYGHFTFSNDDPWWDQTIPETKNVWVK
jgi:hypothetical protein